ncbi:MULTISPECIES: DUF2339 domain-containing protein [Bacillus]|uniref:DUF2339 domain-containing protein n=1 Tax=Bacillus TaxID=1386 RepID=UPI0002DACCD7|nr:MULTISPECIES: DUF2339 domain-containing protein [Bacillus]
MNDRDIEKKIHNLELAISTMNDLLVELRQQKIEMKKKEIHDEKPINLQSAPIKPPPVIIEQPKNADMKNTKLKHERKEQGFDLLKLCQIWLPRIFVGIMLLGVVWLFKAGIDSGILTPPLRLLFGGLLAVILYVIGERQIRAKRHALGLVLLGGSVATVVLTTFAAHYLYAYLPAPIAFILNIMWVVSGIFIANRHKSEYLAIFVAVGGFFVPFLINSQEPNLYVFLGYETFLTICLLLYAWKKIYHILYVSSYGVAQIIFFIFLAFVQNQEVSIEISIVYTLLQLVLFLQLWLDRTFIYIPRLGIWAFNGILLFMSFSALHSGSTLSLFITSIVYLLISYFEIKKDRQSLLSAIAFTLGMVHLSIVISQQFSGDIQIILFLIQGFLALYVGYLLKNMTKLIVGGLVYIFAILLTLVTPIYDLLSTAFLAHILIIVTFAYGIYKAGSVVVKQSKLGYQLWFYVFMLLVFIVLTKSGGVISDDSDINSFTISFLWMIYASMAVWYGRMKKTMAIFTKNEIIYIGLIVLSITVGKLFLLDLVVVSMTIRATLFLVIGAIGVGISRMFFIKK